MTPLSAVAMAACLAIGPASDEVLLRDIAPAFQIAEGLPLDAVISLAPAPGVERHFGMGELQRIAQRLNLPEPQREICVERAVAPLTAERVLQAMQAQIPSA